MSREIFADAVATHAIKSLRHDRSVSRDELPQLGSARFSHVQPGSTEVRVEKFIKGQLVNELITKLTLVVLNDDGVGVAAGNPGATLAAAQRPKFEFLIVEIPGLINNGAHDHVKEDD